MIDRIDLKTGYGLEPIIPDVYTGRLQRDVIAPAFRDGDYIGGINTSIDQIINRINSGEPFVDKDKSDHTNVVGFNPELFGPIFFL